MVPIDSIFFDVDGTLVDSRKDIANAVNFTLRKLGVSEEAEGKIVSYIGTGVKDLIRKSLGPGKAGLLDEGIKYFSEYYMQHSADTARLYPHVKETLEYFKDKKKYVITNRYAKSADMTLKGLFIRQHFADILGGDDENCLKPAACALTNFFPKLKIDKDKSIIVGDMAVDILAGKNSGIKTCWVTYGLGKMADVRPLKPDYMIDDIAQLRQIIR